MVQIILIVLGVILSGMGIKGMSGEGFWITSSKQVTGGAAKAVAISAIAAGALVIAYALFVLPG